MNRQLQRHVLASLILAVSIVATANTASAQSLVTGNWVYSDNGGGFFEHRGNGQWVEVIGNDGSEIRFRQVNSGNDWIELYDANRQIWVRLEQASCQIRYPGSYGYRFLYSGRFQ